MVDDQFGRLTFADEIARGIVHLLETRPEPGVYNLSSAGPVQSWADIAAAVFTARGREAAAVTPVDAQTYGLGKSLAPRPQHSALDLTKITATGFEPLDGPRALEEYLRRSA